MPDLPASPTGLTSIHTFKAGLLSERCSFNRSAILIRDTLSTQEKFSAMAWVLLA